jgi:hypothetical protein
MASSVPCYVGVGRYHLLSGADDAKIILWNAENGHQLQVLEAHVKSARQFVTPCCCTVCTRKRRVKCIALGRRCRATASCSRASGRCALRVLACPRRCRLSVGMPQALTHSAALPCRCGAWPSRPTARASCRARRITGSFACALRACVRELCRRRRPAVACSPPCGVIPYSIASAKPSGAGPPMLAAMDGTRPSGQRRSACC